MSLCIHTGIGPKVIICCLLPVMIASCAAFNVQQLPDIGDGGLLTGTPCGPPCFWNIIPGTSREAEVTSILEPIDIFHKCEPFNNESISGWRGISCGSLNIAFRRGTDIVETIGFVPSQKITVGQVVASYGEPDAINVGAVGSPDRINTGMGLSYKKIHTIIGLASQAGSSFYVDASIRLKGSATLMKHPIAAK